MVVAETAQVKFKETLAVLTGDRFFERCPFDATVTSIMFHFPPGCSALVDVAVGHSEKHVFPREGYIALDATTPVFNTGEDVNENEQFWCEINNTDAVNPHTLSVVLTLQRRA